MKQKGWRKRQIKLGHSLPDEEDGRRWLVEVVLALLWVVGVSGGNGGGGGGVDTGLLGGRGGGGGGGTDCSVAPFSELWVELSVGSSNNAEP